MASRSASGVRPALGLVVSLALVACGGNSSSAEPSVLPTASPTVAPSPSPSPVDVSALFLTQMGSLQRGALAIDASGKIGPFPVVLTGKVTFDGDDSTADLSETVESTEIDVAAVQFAGDLSTKLNDGPWLPGPSGKTGISNSILDVHAMNFTDIGQHDWKGHLVHRLAADSSSFDPSALIPSAAGVSSINASLAYFASADGTPVGATVVMNWTQETAGVRLPGHIEMDIEFSELGQAQSIRAPAQVWKAFMSDRYDYSLFYPTTFTPDHDDFWDFFGTFDGSTYIGVGRDSTHGDNLATLTKAETATLKTEFKTRTVTAEPTVVAGQDAELLTLTGTDQRGALLLREVLFVNGDHEFVVYLISPVGQEGSDTLLFRQLLSTFTLL